jgi:hypothetical protein
MTGESKPGDAVADKARDEFDKNRRERELAIERLRIRAEMRSENFEEDSKVIHAEADRRVSEREGSEPPPSKVSPLVIVLTVVRKFPQWGAVLVALAAIAAYVALRLAK